MLLFATLRYEICLCYKLQQDIKESAHNNLGLFFESISLYVSGPKLLDDYKSLLRENQDFQIAA